MWNNIHVTCGRLIAVCLALAQHWQEAFFDLFTHRNIFKPRLRGQPHGHTTIRLRHHDGRMMSCRLAVAVFGWGCGEVILCGHKTICKQITVFIQGEFNMPTTTTQDDLRDDRPVNRTTLSVCYNKYDSLNRFVMNLPGQLSSRW